MSAVIRASLLVFPLVIVAVLGSIHIPEANGIKGNYSRNLAMTSLPALPAWAEQDLPDFSVYQDTTEKKAAFFSFLYPRIVLANSRILIERNYLERLSEKEQLSEPELTWLKRQSDRLRVDAELGSPEMFEALRTRLDIVAPSLILAQAANESAWGTSRFAVKGNNLFGQWCFSKGCGLVPLSRSEGANHEVAKFDSPYRSIRSYIQNLNRHTTYEPLRETRLEARSNDNWPKGTRLASGLIGYSERGEDYVEEIRNMITYNNLTYYDQQFREIIREKTPSHLQQLAGAGKENTLLPATKSSLAADREG